MNSQKIVRLNRRIYKKRVRYWLTLFHGIGKCTYGSGASTRIAIAILAKFNVPLNFWQSAGFALFYGIGKCTYGSGASTRIAIAILAKFNVPLNFWQSAGFALFYGIGNCSYSSGTPTRIALAILGVQSAGFALF